MHVNCQRRMIHFRTHSDTLLLSAHTCSTEKNERGFGCALTLIEGTNHSHTSLIICGVVCRMIEAEIYFLSSCITRVVNEQSMFVPWNRSTKHVFYLRLAFIRIRMRQRILPAESGFSWKIINFERFNAILNKILKYWICNRPCERTDARNACVVPQCDE